MQSCFRHRTAPRLDSLWRCRARAQHDPVRATRCDDRTPAEPSRVAGRDPRRLHTLRCRRVRPGLDPRARARPCRRALEHRGWRDRRGRRNRPATRRRRDPRAKPSARQGDPHLKSALRPRSHRKRPVVARTIDATIARPNPAPPCPPRSARARAADEGLGQRRHDPRASPRRCSPRRAARRTKTPDSSPIRRRRCAPSRFRRGSRRAAPAARLPVTTAGSSESRTGCRGPRHPPARRRLASATIAAKSTGAFSSASPLPDPASVSSASVVAMARSLVTRRAGGACRRPPRRVGLRRPRPSCG